MIDAAATEEERQQQQQRMYSQDSVGKKKSANYYDLDTFDFTQLKKQEPTEALKTLRTAMSKYEVYMNMYSHNARALSLSLYLTLTLLLCRALIVTAMKVASMCTKNSIGLIELSIHSCHFNLILP